MPSSEHEPQDAKATTAIMGGVHFRFVNDLATSRACSIKRVATGLSVRFFRVITPIGMLGIGGSTDRTLISGCRVGNRKADACKIVRSVPVNTRLTRVSTESVTTTVRG